MNNPTKMSDTDFLVFSSSIEDNHYYDWSLLQCVLIGQFIFSYDSYYDNDISVYVTKMH